MSSPRPQHGIFHKIRPANMFSLPPGLPAPVIARSEATWQSAPPKNHRTPPLSSRPSAPPLSSRASVSESRDLGMIDGAKILRLRFTPLRMTHLRTAPNIKIIAAGDTAIVHSPFSILHWPFSIVHSPHPLKITLVNQLKMCYKNYITTKEVILCRKSFPACTASPRNTRSSS